MTISSKDSEFNVSKDSDFSASIVNDNSELFSDSIVDDTTTSIAKAISDSENKCMNFTSDRSDSDSSTPASGDACGSDSKNSEPCYEFSDHVSMDVNSEIFDVSKSELCGCNDSNCANCLVHMHEVIYRSGMYNFQGCRIPVKSNLKIEFWRQHLRDYRDGIIVQFLEYGWPINYDFHADPISSDRNHSTAQEFPETIDNYICTEVAHGALAGPFLDCPFNNGLVISPLHTVPKKGHSNARRVVLDLSHPPGHSVNDGISNNTYIEEDLQLTYPTVDRFIELIIEKSNGSEAWMLKRDLSRAYRQLRVDPHDYRFLGFSWNNEMYFDVAPPFGLRSAAQACQRTTDGLAYILLERGIKVINYVDDIACAMTSKEEADMAGKIIDQTICESGLVLAEEKSVNCTQVLTFLGIQFNSQKLTMEVMDDRLIEITNELKLWSSKRYASKREIQSLAGKLMFIAKCCKHGRCFMARILAALKKLKRQSHRTYLNLEFRRDVQWWIQFLPHFHSTSIIITSDWSNPDGLIATDSCLKGCGGTFISKKRYFACTFPQDILDGVSGITQLECMAVIVALKLWCHELKGLKFVIRCDNSATVSVINSGRSQELFLQQCAREIAFLACKHEFQIHAVHISGLENRLPDFLSRICLDKSYLDKFVSEAPAYSSWRRDYISKDMFLFTCAW